MFLNFPFARAYEPLFLALLTGLTALGMKPRCVLELPDGGQGRLARIRELLTRTSASVHDLSWVRASVVSGRRLPRFNMPFELGLAAMLQSAGRHRFFVLEAVPYRLQRTLSDLNGVDPLIHGNQPRELLRCLLGAFGNPRGSPPLGALHTVWTELCGVTRHYKRENAVDGVFDAEAFRALSVAAVEIATRHGLLQP